ncbi:MAG: hypothetical protein JNK82_24715 [Myxococcaceae bacterium]|nr:hypothetical protein [Myxococcaceae bacterium]
MSGPLTRVELPDASATGQPRYVTHGGYGGDRVLADGAVVSTGPDAIFEWELATRRLVRTTWFRDGLTVRRVSLDADVFFTEHGVLHVWRRATRTLEPLFAVKEPRLSPDGTHLAQKVGDTVEVTRIADRQVVARIAPRFEHFELGHAGRWLLFTHSVSPQSGSGWLEVAVVETATAKTVLGCEPFGDDASAFFSGDGLAVEFDGSRSDNAPVLLDRATPRIATPKAPQGMQWRKGTVPFAIDARGRPLLWAGRSLDGMPDEPVDVHHAALSCDGAWLAVLDSNGKGFVRSLGTVARQQPLELPRGFRPHALAVTSSGGVVLASLAGVQLPDGRTVKLPKTAWNPQLALSHDARVIAVRGDGALDPVFVLAGGAVTPALEPTSRDAAPRALALSPDGARLATSTWAGLEVWDVETRKRTTFIEGAPLAAALAWSSDGRLHVCRHDTTVSIVE